MLCSHILIVLYAWWYENMNNKESKTVYFFTVTLCKNVSYTYFLDFTTMKIALRQARRNTQNAVLHTLHNKNHTKLHAQDHNTVAMLKSLRDKSRD